MINLFSYWRVVPIAIGSVVIWWYIFHIPSTLKAVNEAEVVKTTKSTVRVETQKKEAFKVKRRLNEVTDDTCESNCTSWL